MTDSKITIHEAWDLNTRLFHWINFLCVIALSIVGLIMLNKSSLGISSVEAGIGLKTLHVVIGYVFTTNLLTRLIWGFVGGPHSRISTLLPGRNFKKELDAFKASVASGKPQTFIGHNPKGRLSVLVMLLLLTIMMATGLIRAGTDIYYPPFGQFAAKYVAAEGISPTQIKPYDETGTNTEKLDELKAFKKPFGTVHIYGAYVLWVLILGHLVAVIRTDGKGHGTIISSMFSGKKYLPREPVDK